jgi:protein involved in polysaccharide export with SLBB domain
MVDRLGREMAQSTTGEISGALTGADVAAEQQIVKAQEALLARIKSFKADGRVVVRIMPGPDFVESTYDIILEDGDHLQIPPKPDTVAISGEVYNPTTLIFESDKPTVKNYLAKTGGPTDYAEEKQMYIVRADGTVVSKAQGNSSMIFGGGFESNVLYPGDTLVVPPKLVHNKFRRDLKAWTSIIYDIAVSTGIVLTQVFN